MQKVQVLYFISGNMSYFSCTDFLYFISGQMLYFSCIDFVRSNSLTFPRVRHYVPHTFNISLLCNEVITDSPMYLLVPSAPPQPRGYHDFEIALLCVCVCVCVLPFIFNFTMQDE